MKINVENNHLVQSPYIYLQTAGSDWSDGSAEGFHLRWDLQRELGEQHLPRGNASVGNAIFNRNGDFVKVFRSKYAKIPTIFSLAFMVPDLVDDPGRAWVFNTTNTGNAIEIYFLEAAAYQNARVQYDPATQTRDFIKAYGQYPVQVGIKDELCFKVGFQIERLSPQSRMRVEAVSVAENVLGADKFVSCRQVFSSDSNCKEGGLPTDIEGGNLLFNGGFELENVGFKSDLTYVEFSELHLASQSYSVYPKEGGLPFPFPFPVPIEGTPYLACANVDKSKDVVLWQQKVKVDKDSNYVFSGRHNYRDNFGRKFPIHARIIPIGGTSADTYSQDLASTSQLVPWEEFVVKWASGSFEEITIEVYRPKGPGRTDRYAIDSLILQKEQTIIPDPQGKCQGPNLIQNPFFDDGDASFFTDYTPSSVPAPGRYAIIKDANVYYRHWEGKAFHGDFFMVVDGAVDTSQVVWRQEVQIDAEKEYCFYGWARSVYSPSPASMVAKVKGKVSGVEFTTSFDLSSNTSLWIPFVVEWGSGQKETVSIEIFASTGHSGGNDFGLDALHFREKKPEGKPCYFSLTSENVHSFRFDLDEVALKIIELETYREQVSEGEWEEIGAFALSLDNQVVENRLENSPIVKVHDQWPKFNGGAKVNVTNYQDRWSRAGGMKEAITEYLSLSQIDPLAVKSLAGDSSIDGSFDASLLNMLQLVALDFHVARMMGLGYIDNQGFAIDETYVHLVEYITEDSLEFSGPGRAQHFYMSVPTKTSDHRLPKAPIIGALDYGLKMRSGALGASPLTDANGYTPEQTARYVNLYGDQLDESLGMGPFFVPDDEFCSIEHTQAVFFGVDYREQGGQWIKPELSHDPNYVDTATTPMPEAIPLANHGDPAKPVYTHRETQEGIHEYGLYGVNWFSRASELSDFVATDFTKFIKPNTLIPPSNFRVQLVQRESPLLLTTLAEQDRLANILGTDKTLIRVTFDYHHLHDLNYAFGDQIEFFFRTEAPIGVSGEIKSVTNHSLHQHLAIVRTQSYTQGSTGDIISPNLAVSDFPNFVGGVLKVGQDSYIIETVQASAVAGEGPVFTVFKIEDATPVTPSANGQYLTVVNHIAPNAGKVFLAIENMADSNSWGSSNPLSTIVQVGGGLFTNHVETVVQDGETTTQDLQGILTTANISALPNVGTYQLTTTFVMAEHPQHTNPDPVFWYKGVVRVRTVNDPSGPPRVLEVLATENIGTSNQLILYVNDPGYDPGDSILTGNNIAINYYPGYKVYLHAEAAKGLSSTAILPASGEGNRKTYMGARSVDTTEQYTSPVGVPAILFALDFIDPLAPELPQGGDYATPPDYYYKSTFTFKTKFQHEPFSAAFYRVNEDSILRALYTSGHVEQILDNLHMIGEEDEYKADRWRNLVSFHYQYSSSSDQYHDPTGNNPAGVFRMFPRENGYRFPNPNKPPLFDGTKVPGDVLDEIKIAIYSAFTPITELPLIYKYIEGGNYQPTNRKQKVRNAQGHVLAANDPEFLQAPMAKRVGVNEVQFTDFTLDGTSSNHFFYCVREIGNRNTIGDPSPILGPIFLINSRPIEAPQLRGLTQIPARNGEDPRIVLQINGYDEQFRVKRFRIYRANDPVNALSVRTMDLVKTVDLMPDHLIDGFNYSIEDDFEVGPVPYGDPVTYKLEAMVPVKDENGNDHWAPSRASKGIMTTIVDTVNPEAPELDVDFVHSQSTAQPELQQVKLKWSKTAYNATYYLEKQNRVGNWRLIYEIQSNQDDFIIDLNSTTVASSTLPKENDEGDHIYHRFRVRVMNTGGLFNLREKEVTV